MVECSDCKKLFIYDRKKGHRKTTCNSCLVIQRRRNLKKKLVEYKGGKCIKCNYNKSLRALSFHHLDPSQKDFEVNTSSTIAWNRLVKEVDKCILVCANCHMEIHEDIQG